MRRTHRDALGSHPSHYLIHLSKILIDPIDGLTGIDIAFGKYDGDVKLVVYDSSGNFKESFDCRDKILKVDGRLPHRVRKTPNFLGDHFSVIWYKSFDGRCAHDSTCADSLTNPHFAG